MQVTREPEIRILTPAPFPYQDTHKVPWVYETKVQLKDGLKKESPDIEGITRTGRCYTSDDIEQRRQERLKDIEKLPDKATIPKNGEEDEFLRIMKQSEYSITEQLSKTPARISLFSLIMGSEVHRKALQDMLNKAFVRPDISTENLVSMVDPIKHRNLISFSAEEIPSASSSDAPALYLSVTCCGYIATKVLIDGGSALNVLPYKTLRQLPVDLAKMEATPITVRAFDGNASRTMGQITLPVTVGPGEFQVELEVMDIAPSYTILLGRPWIHEAGAVPSTLHQKVKFPWNGAIVSVKGEEELLLSASISVPRIEPPQDSSNDIYHSFEIVKEAAHINISNHESNQNNPRGLAIMKKWGYQPGTGLGLHKDGIQEPVTAAENTGTQGLGFQEDIITMMKKCSLKDKQIDIKKTHLKDFFPVATKVINTAANTTNPQVNMTGFRKSTVAALRPSQGASLKNWEYEGGYDVTM